MFRLRCVLVVCAMALGQPLRPQALRALLPAECPVAVEVHDPVAAWTGLVQSLADLPQHLPEGIRAAIGLGRLLLPFWIGREPAALLRELAAGGLAVGWLPGPAGPEPVLLLRGGDPVAAGRWLERLQSGMQWRHHGQLLLVARSTGVLQRLASAVEAGAGRFGAWAEPPAAVAAAYVDLAALRPVLPALRRGASGLDLGGRLLFGGLAEVLHQAERLTLALRLGCAVQVAAVFDRGIGQPFCELWPARGTARALPPASPRTLLSLSADRSVRHLLADPERFLPPDQVAQAQSFLSIADQVDGNSSFVDDLLGGLHEPWHLFLLAPDEEALDEDQVPDLLLPEFALLARTHGAAVERILGRTAQVLVVIANADRAQRRLPPFVLQPLRDGIMGFVARPLPWRGPGAPPLEQALSPALAFGHGHCVLASTESAARAVLAAVAEADAATGPPEILCGDRLEVRGAALQQWLDRVRGPLVLSRMLDEGETRAEAEAFFAALAGLSGAFEWLRCELRSDAASTELRLEARRR